MRRLALVLLVVEVLLFGLHSANQLARTRTKLVESEERISVLNEALEELNVQRVNLLETGNAIDEDLKSATQRISLLEDTVRLKDRGLAVLKAKESALEESREEQGKTTQLLSAALSFKELELSELRENCQAVENSLQKAKENEEALTAALLSRDQAISRLEEELVTLEGIHHRAVNNEKALRAELLSKDQTISQLKGKAPFSDKGKRVISTAIRINQELLGGLEGVEVVVEDFSHVVEEDGLSPQQIKKEVEDMLRRAEIVVLTPLERMKVDGMPYLSISIDAAKDDNRDYVYYIELQLKEMAVLQRDRSKMSTGAAIWRKAVLSKKRELEDIRVSIADLVGVFLSDFTAANPKLTTKLPPFRERREEGSTQGGEVLN